MIHCLKWNRYYIFEINVPGGMNTPKMISKSLLLSSAIWLFLLSPVHLSPVVFPFVIDPNNAYNIPQDYCNLTPNFGYSGSIKFVEDCENLDVFPILPIPGPTTQQYGVHPVVCCPKVSKKNICFPTDPWCPTYVKPNTPPPELYDDDYDDYEIVTDRIIIDVPKVSDEDCSAVVPFWGNGTRCVNFKDCPDLFGPPLNPTSVGLTKNPSYARYCGWDDEDKAAKVCCPGASIQGENIRVQVSPRYPGNQCKDKVNQCKKWKNNNGCRTDMDFVIDPEEPDNGRSISAVMFGFMMGACMETCEWCGDKGCRDEHPDCPAWARQGFCITQPELLTHTCRESCGVCGFLSADNKTVQVVGNNTYTDFRDSNFDCGRYKLFSEFINPNLNPDEKDYDIETDQYYEDYYETNQDYEDYEDYNIESDDDYEPEPRKKRSVDGQGINFCGASVIADKWMVTAAHCYDDKGSSVGQRRQVNINTVRDNTPFEEVFDVKRIYKHPKFRYPYLYNDIALLELGRRIEYNWEKYGDSPFCFDTVGENDGKIAIVQGYEYGTFNIEANTTVIGNTKCREMLDFNTIDDTNIRAKIKGILPNGPTDRVFCTVSKNIRIPCTGDSGGPLFVQREDGRSLLIGIVSGGIGCGQGYPSWYTKLAFFKSWIECIIDNRKIYQNKETIQRKCDMVADKVEEANQADVTTSAPGNDLPGVDLDDDKDADITEEASLDDRIFDFD